MNYAQIVVNFGTVDVAQGQIPAVLMHPILKFSLYEAPFLSDFQCESGSPFGGSIVDDVCDHPLAGATGLRSVAEQILDLETLGLVNVLRGDHPPNARKAIPRERWDADTLDIENRELPSPAFGAFGRKPYCGTLREVTVQTW